MNYPQAAYLAHKAEIDAAIARVLDKGQYILGEEVEAFEREFADFLGVRHAIAVGNGTDALHLAMRACGIGAGDTVATVSHTAVATVAAIELAGASALLLDIDPRSFTLSVDALAGALEEEGQSNIRAVIPVHLYGHPADMKAILSIARKHGARVIEDCAQAAGAMISGRAVGTLGDIAAFSFYPTKNLGAIGDGGAVVTNDGGLAEQVRMLREYGWKQRFQSERPGLNSRLDEMQAAILRVKLHHLAAENARRRELAASYSRLLSDADLILPSCAAEMTHAFHQYVVRTSGRDALRRFLDSEGIPTRIHYPDPVHVQSGYSDRKRVRTGGLSATERISPEILSLPFHPFLTESDLTRMGESIRRGCERLKGEL
jgi:dTDP-4-amino-4,6-dideoxygalactose transaminase